MFKLILFLILNFAALGIGGFLIGNTATNEWYQQANKAPWTPPGWVFGFAWTTIMVCFSVFMYMISAKYSTEQLNFFYVMFAIQWILNVIWNPIFFRFHMVLLGLVIIIALLVFVAWFTIYGFKKGGYAGILMLPYLVWLMIATSLNAYIYLKN